MKRAVVLSENFPPSIGGTSRWFWEIYKRFPDSAVVAAGEHPLAASFDADSPLETHRLPLSFSDRGCFGWTGMRQYQRSGRALRRVLRGVLGSMDHGRLHCGRLLPEGWLARRLGAPYLCFVHGEDLAIARRSRQMTWMVRRVLGSADFLVANSDRTKRVLVDDWSVAPGRVRRLHPGVDIQEFVPAAADVVVRGRLGWGERPVVLTASRLEERKGHDRLIEAIAAVRESIPNILYAVVGDGMERARLEASVRRENLDGYVHFHGELPDAELLQAYQQCDLFVLPNRTCAGEAEGFGMVLLEAQACGKPVIAGDSGGTRETMRVGVTGRIVDCENVEALRQAVAESLADRPGLARMGAEARRWAESFDFAARVPEAAEVLEIGGAT